MIKGQHIEMFIKRINIDFFSMNAQMQTEYILKH
jgi:hypothetical protein